MLPDLPADVVRAQQTWPRVPGRKLSTGWVLASQLRHHERAANKTATTFLPPTGANVKQPPVRRGHCPANNSWCTLENHKLLNWPDRA